MGKNLRKPDTEAKGVNAVNKQDGGAMNLIILSPYAQSIVSFRGALIRALIERNIKVSILAPDYTPELRKSVERLGGKALNYPLNRTSMNPLVDLHTLITLRAFFNSARPEAVFSYNPKPVIYGTLAAYLAGVPHRFAMVEGLGYAFTPQCQFSFKQALLRNALILLYKIAINRATRVFFLNRDDLATLCALTGLSSQKAVLIGGIGVDLDEWPFCPPHLHPLTFTLAARLLREKGVEEFAQAARDIKSRYGYVRFLLLGALDTNPGALTEAEVRAWVQEGILEWPGSVSNMQAYLAQTSVYVLPSYYREGVPRSTQEAMAMGRPVITTDAPGCRETVVEGVNGFWVPPRNAAALVKMMEHFIQDPSLIESMGRESRRLAEERFDVHKINQHLIAEMFPES